MQTSSHENEAQRADDADGEHEQSTTLVELPLELLVKICLAVGSDDRASLCVVATSLASAVHEAAHIGGVATARLRGHGMASHGFWHSRKVSSRHFSPTS